MSEQHALVAHQFDDPQQQHESAYLGMWVFLVTEVMFLGALVGAYCVYRMIYADAFIAAGRHLFMWLGALNTAVLLCSSLTMALAVRAAQRGRRRALIALLLATLLLGLVFLAVKATEYTLEYREGLVPLRGFTFRYDGPDPARAGLFFNFYFALTGLHALHLIIAVALVGGLALLAWRGHVLEQRSTPVEMIGLFWHFVDIVWVFLFPLLYLVG